MNARVAIRRVRFKAGGEVHLLRQSADDARARALRDVRMCLDGQKEVAGFAFVVWGDADSTAAHWAGPESTIPAILIPDYVRNRLLAMQIERWTLDTFNNS